MKNRRGGRVRIGEEKIGKTKKDEKRKRNSERNGKPQLSLFDLLARKRAEPRRAAHRTPVLRGSGLRTESIVFTRNTLPIQPSRNMQIPERRVRDRRVRNGQDVKTITVKASAWNGRTGNPENSIRIDLKWDEVAVRIADLIDEDKYLTAKKRRTTKSGINRNRRKTETAGRRKRKRTILCPSSYKHKPVRKQHIRRIRKK